MADDLSWATSAEIAKAVGSGQASALGVIDAALARIGRLNPVLNVFTAITAERARAKAKAVDASDKSKLPLAGVPFAVKNLFDIEGIPTVAGSKINRSHPPAKHDSPLIERLDAVGGGLVPLALGSDTNGSIRVPSSLCGIFGLKPTYDRLTRARSFPFVASLDHLGPFARSTRDLAVSYDVMQGFDAEDAACVDRPVEPATPQLEQGLKGLRIAVAGGYFKEGALPEALAALDRVAKAAGAREEVEIPEAARARAAAYVITATEGAVLHLDCLRRQARDFDPAVRDRLLAGAMVPSTLVVKAQIFRRWYRERVLQLFEKYDAILAPATPCTAPKIGQQTFVIDGVELPVRPNVGIYTQPISFIGLPVVAVPVPLSPLPIAVQIIAAPWREDIALRIGHALEQMGAVAAPKPNLSGERKWRSTCRR